MLAPAMARLEQARTTRVALPDHLDGAEYERKLAEALEQGEPVEPDGALSDSLVGRTARRRPRRTLRRDRDDRPALARRPVESADRPAAWIKVNAKDWRYPSRRSTTARSHGSPPMTPKGLSIESGERGPHWDSGIEKATEAWLSDNNPSPSSSVIRPISRRRRALAPAGAGRLPEGGGGRRFESVRGLSRGPALGAGSRFLV